MHTHQNDFITHLILFIWQVLIWISISFLVGAYFFHRPNSMDQSHDHFAHSEISSWVVSSRTQVTVSDKSRIDADLTRLMTQIHSWQEHEAPSLPESEAQQKYSELCSIYSNHCSRTYWVGQYGRWDKYLYQWLSIVLLQYIDARLRQLPWVDGVLSEFKIYQSEDERRWSAGHTTVKVNSTKIPTSREYREVLTHELWHTVDLGVLLWSNNQKNRAFTEFGKVIRAKDDPSISFYKLSRLGESTRKAEASFKDFVSGYAMKSVYEDFAETQNLWFNHNLLFQQLAQSNPLLQKKYEYFKTIYNNSWFDDNPDSATKVTLTKRPWDTTRIE